MVVYTVSNGTVCWESFSHPNYQPDSYLVNITELTHLGGGFFLSLNTTKCLSLGAIDDLRCGVFLVTAAALNQLGSSERNELTITLGK